MSDIHYIEVVFIKEHQGQHKAAGDVAVLEQSVAKHLIRFGYARQSGLQRPSKAKKQVSKESQ